MRPGRKINIGDAPQLRIKLITIDIRVHSLLEYQEVHQVLGGDRGRKESELLRPFEAGQANNLCLFGPARVRKVSRIWAIIFPRAMKV